MLLADLISNESVMTNLQDWDKDSDESDASDGGGSDTDMRGKKGASDVCAITTFVRVNVVI